MRYASAVVHVCCCTRSGNCDSVAPDWPAVSRGVAVQLLLPPMPLAAAPAPALPASCAGSWPTSPLACRLHLTAQSSATPLPPPPTPTWRTPPLELPTRAQWPRGPSSTGDLFARPIMPMVTGVATMHKAHVSQMPLAGRACASDADCRVRYYVGEWLCAYLAPTLWACIACTRARNPHA